MEGLYRGPHQKEKGFTLVEALITVLVVGIALAASLLASNAIQRTGEGAHQHAVAIQDANRVVEQMRGTAIAGVFPGNVTGAYPNNGVVAGFNNLTNEQVRVTYVNTNANPLDTTVTVTWTDNQNRNGTEALRTLITQRS